MLKSHQHAVQLKLSFQETLPLQANDYSVGKRVAASNLVQQRAGHAVIVPAVNAHHDQRIAARVCFSTWSCPHARKVYTDTCDQRHVMLI